MFPLNIVIACHIILWINEIWHKSILLLFASRAYLLQSCAKDYCDSVVTCLCSGIETCRFPHDDAVLRLLLLAYVLLALVLAVLLYAYVLVGRLVLVVWWTSNLVLLIRCKHIYNFWCSKLVLHQLVYVLITLRGVFMHFLELTN
jgi:hypothetical protein